MGHSVGLRDGSERIRDMRRAPKGSEREGCFEVAIEGAFGEIFERVFEKGCEGVFEGGCEGVFRRISERLSSKGSREGVFEGGCEGFFRRVLRRGLPEDANGSSGRFPRGAAMTVGSKVGG